MSTPTLLSWGVELSKVDDHTFIQRVKREAEKTGQDFWRLMVILHPVREQHKEFCKTLVMTCVRMK